MYTVTLYTLDACPLPECVDSEIAETFDVAIAIASDMGANTERARYSPDMSITLRLPVDAASYVVIEETEELR